MFAVLTRTVCHKMLPVIRKVFKELYNSIQNFDQIKAMYTYLLTYSVQQSPS